MRTVAHCIGDTTQPTLTDRTITLTITFILFCFAASSIVYQSHPWDEESGFGEKGLTALLSTLALTGTPGNQNDPGGTPPNWQGVIPAPINDLAVAEPDTLTEIVEEINREQEITKIFMPNEVDKVPELVWMIYPEFPDQAKSDRINGVATLEILIDERGYPIEITLVGESPEGYGFGEASVHAAESAVFKPATFEEETVRCRIKLPVEFDLEYY